MAGTGTVQSPYRTCDTAALGWVFAFQRRTKEPVCEAASVPIVSFFPISPSYILAPKLYLCVKNRTGRRQPSYPGVIMIIMGLRATPPQQSSRVRQGWLIYGVP